MQNLADGITAFRTMSPGEVIVWSLIWNIVIFGMTLVIGHLMVRLWRDKRIAPVPEPITPIEYVLAASTVVINAGVLVVGAWLWRADLIHVRYDYAPLPIVVDTLILFFAMDVLMYFSHRIAHLPWLYPLLHRTHHQYENPRPLTLFVLNPFETLGFGVLWILLLMVYTSSWVGIMIYLTLNLLFGLVGHLGVEPFPKAWVNLPLIRYISTSTFHAEHHDDRYHNFGFYTLIWDRLFGTISPEYLDDFRGAGSP